MLFGAVFYFVDDGGALQGLAAKRKTMKEKGGSDVVASIHMNAAPDLKERDPGDPEDRSATVTVEISRKTEGSFPVCLEYDKRKEGDGRIYAKWSEDYRITEKTDEDGYEGYWTERHCVVFYDETKNYFKIGVINDEKLEGDEVVAISIKPDSRYGIDYENRRVEVKIEDDDLKTATRKTEKRK